MTAAQETKVVLITPGFSGGGYQMLFRLIRALVGNSIHAPSGSLTVIGAGPRTSAGPAWEPNVVKVRRFPWIDYNRVAHIAEGSILFNGFFESMFLAYAVLVLCVISRRERSIRVLSNGPVVSLPAILVRKLAGPKIEIFSWFHTDVSAAGTPLARGYLRFLSRSSKHLFVNSEDVQKDVISAGIPSFQVSIVRNWVEDAEPFPIQPDLVDRVREFRARHPFTATYVGRMVQYKHVLTYLEAARLNDDVRLGFIFVGSGELEGQVRRLEDSTRGSILFLGELPNEAVR